MDKPRQISVDTFRNRNRVLVLFSPSQADPDRQEQQEMLQGQSLGLEERDIVVLEVFEKGVATLNGVPIRLLGTSELRMRFECRKGEFRAVLLGKDGRNTQSFDQPVEASRIFGLVDTSPQRLDEIKRRGDGEPYAG